MVTRCLRKLNFAGQARWAGIAADLQRTVMSAKMLLGPFRMRHIWEQRCHSETNGNINCSLHDSLYFPMICAPYVHVLLMSSFDCFLLEGRTQVLDTFEQNSARDVSAQYIKCLLVFKTHPLLVRKVDAYTCKSWLQSLMFLLGCDLRKSYGV